MQEKQQRLSEKQKGNFEKAKKVFVKAVKELHKLGFTVDAEQKIAVNMRPMNVAEFDEVEKAKFRDNFTK